MFISAILIFYCCRKISHKFYSLKAIYICYLLVSTGEESRHGLEGCSGLQKASVKMLAMLHSFLEIRPFPNSHNWWHTQFLVGLRPSPIFLLADTQGLLLASRSCRQFLAMQPSHNLTAYFLRASRRISTVW